MKKKIEQLRKMLSLIIATILTCIGNIGNFTATFGLAVLDISLFGQQISYAGQKKIGEITNYKDPLIADGNELSNQITSFYFQHNVEFPEPRKNYIHASMTGEPGSRDKMYRTPNKPHFNKNLSFIDRIARIMLTVICIQLFLSGISSEELSLLVLTIILTILPTAIFGFCPFYYIAGLSTCNKKQEFTSFQKN
jgi:hypothetical protein